MIPRGLRLAAAGGILVLAAACRDDGQAAQQVRTAAERGSAVAADPAVLAADEARMPRFEDYPVADTFTGTPAPVDLNSAEGARRFRTALRQAAAKGPDFAGRYTVVSWGCGTACQSFAIVDARTGRVTFGPHPTSVGLAYRLDSSLLVTDPIGQWRKAYGPQAEDAVGGNAESFYYHWNGERLRLVDAIELGTPLRRERAVPRQVHSGATRP